MGANFKFIFAILVAIFSLHSHSYAAPTRTSVPTGLFPAIDNPVFFNSAINGGTPYGPHLDKFYDQTGSEQTIFTVKYNTDEPVIMYSLRGAKFVSVSENTDKTELTISFSPYLNFAGADDAIYLQLFTNSLFDNPSDPSGLKDVLKGAFFDSKLSHFNLPPNIIKETSEDYFGYPAIQLRFTEDNNNFQQPGGVRMFLPAGLLTYFNVGAKPSNLFLKRYSSDGTLFYANHFDVGTILNGGILYDLTRDTTSTTYGWKFELSKTPKVGLTASKKKFTKTEDVYLRGYVKACTKKFATSLESRDTENDEFKKVRGYNVSGCEFNAVVHLKKTKELRFKYKTKYFSKIVKVGPANN